MAVWGPAVAEELRRDVRFALTFKVGKSRRPLTDTERDMVADAIVDHIKLCNWKVEGGRHGADLRISQEDRSRTGETQSGCKATPDYIGPMCGRFTYRLTWPELVRLYRLTLDTPARNIVLSENVIRLEPRPADGVCIPRLFATPGRATQPDAGTRPIRVR